ncbi:MAG: ABC-F family ATP-binding cassette domain-containing protein [Alphaproteobacteria bacterium]|jgi:ATPase subunit of ABC transporter with duplicated ATPase domains
MPEIFMSVSEGAYTLPDGPVLFENVSLDISGGEKLALIGDNGAGKTTLLKILAGELELSAGNRVVQAAAALLPQDISSLHGTVASVLNAGETLAALAAIEAGDVSEALFETLGNRWDFPARLEEEFRAFGMGHITPDASFDRLSGGEKEKVLLAGMFLSGADILLFDEPTNNLDAAGKMLFYNRMEKAGEAVLVVSHDRELLERMSAVIELSHSGTRRYGGNYSFYRECRAAEREAVEERKTNLIRERNRLAATREKISAQAGKKDRYGRKMIVRNRFLPIAAKDMKAGAEVARAKKMKLLNGKIENRQAEIARIKNETREEFIRIPMPGKPFLKERLAVLENVSFGYGPSPLFADVNAVLSGQSRIRLCGGNGSGKTTLIKILMGVILPDSGRAELNGRAVYLNQELSLPDRRKSLLDNVIDFNPGLKINEAYTVLARFLFKNTAALKTAGTLSGGELLRLSLAMILGTREQPELLIFDEPTNNLDIRSSEILESALRQYQGALLVVSHDAAFVRGIGLSEEIRL